MFLGYTLAVVVPLAILACFFLATAAGRVRTGHLLGAVVALWFCVACAFSAVVIWLALRGTYGAG